MNQFGLIRDVKAEPNKNDRQNQPAITHMALFVSQQCNLDCIYCYGDGGKYGNESFMNHSVAFQAVNWLITQSREKRQLGINFFGGEPFLNYPLIKLIVDYAKTTGNNKGYDFEFGITTNATLLDDDKINFMVHNKITPVVSFDGSKKLQDRQRPFKNGRGSYFSAYYKIKKLLKRIPESICRATLIDGSDHAQIENKLKEVGFTRIQLTVATPSLDSPGLVDRNIPRLLDNLDHIALDVLNAIKTRDKDFLRGAKYTGLGWHLCRMLEQYINKQKRFFACGAGRSGVAVSTVGDIYLCHRFVGNQKYILGNISKLKLNRTLYQVSPIKHNRQCRKCYAKYFCAGGCYHDNAGMTGTISSPATDMCLLMRNLANYAGIIKCKLNGEDVNYLITENIIERKACILDLF